MEFNEKVVASLSLVGKVTKASHNPKRAKSKVYYIPPIASSPERIHYKHASAPEISEEHLLESAQRFETFKAQRIADGMPPPFGYRSIDL